VQRTTRTPSINLLAFCEIGQCYQENANKNERLGKLIDRVGMTPFKEAIT